MKGKERIKKLMKLAGAAIIEDASEAEVTTYPKFPCFLLAIIAIKILYCVSGGSG